MSPEMPAVVNGVYSFTHLLTHSSLLLFFVKRLFFITIIIIIIISMVFPTSITPESLRKPCVGRNIDDSDADLYAEYHGDRTGSHNNSNEDFSSLYAGGDGSGLYFSASKDGTKVNSSCLSSSPLSTSVSEEPSITSLSPPPPSVRMRHGDGGAGSRGGSSSVCRSSSTLHPHSMSYPNARSSISDLYSSDPYGADFLSDLSMAINTEFSSIDHLAMGTQSSTPSRDGYDFHSWIQGSIKH